MSTFDQSQTSDSTFGLMSPKAVAPPPTHTVPPGLVDHPDYEVKRELGRGGMGVVYLAHNRLMGRDEVLKVMGRHIMERPGVLERFLREIRAVARLRHPNIVTAYHATRLGDNVVFAMEYVEGLDLSRMIKAKGPLPVGHACNFVYQASLGLQHAHEEGLVHRDIKPGNLMVTRSGHKATIKILDFGLAKASREQEANGALTYKGQALGTPDFIAPEQIVNAPDVDIRADIYSLGGTLYYLLTASPPFRANSLYDIYQAHISRDADPLNLIRPEVPVELAALVAKMMAKDPKKRFQTPVAVSRALAPFFQRAAAHRLVPIAENSQIELSARLAPVALAEAKLGQSESPATTPAPHPRPASRPGARRTAEETPILIREADRPGDIPRPKPAKMKTLLAEWTGRRRRSVWPALAGVMLSLAIFAAWLFMPRIDTSHGIVELANVPEDAAPQPIASQASPTGEVDDRHAQSPGPEKATIPDGSLGEIREFADRSPRQVVLLSPDDKQGTVISGSWMAQGDELVQTSEAYQISELVFGDPNWSHYDLSFEVRKETEGQGNMGGRRFTTFFHWTSRKNKCWYSGYNGAHEIASVVNGHWSRNWELKAGNWVWAKGELQDGKWYPVSIKVRGRAVKCYFNENLMFEDVHPSLSHGRIGLGCADADVRFRRIKVTDPDGKVLFEGLPNIASGTDLAR
jgi:serine/threonine protein kinase